jgi:GNAT superfamily N-acetyltransferase
VTTDLPDLSRPIDLHNEIGLKTREEFLEHRNPGEKFHLAETYDWGLAQLNKDYSLQPVAERTTGATWGNDLFDIWKARKGYIIRDATDDDVVGVVVRGTLYYTLPSMENKLPRGYAKGRRPGESEWVDLGVKKTKRVKYLSEVLPFVSDAASANLAEFPVVLRRFKIKGEPFTLRARKMPETDRGTTLVLLNDEGQKVAQASNEWGATLLVVAREYRGKGLGKVLGEEWYRLNPEFESGGFTPGGERNALRMWEARVREFLSRGWYSELIRQGKVTKREVQAILAGLSGKRHRLPLPGSPEAAPKPEAPKKLLVYADYPTFVVYDARFLDDPQDEDADDHIKGYGFFRDNPSVGDFLYTLDYERPFQDLVTSVALQMARDEGEPVWTWSSGRGSPRSRPTATASPSRGT